MELTPRLQAIADQVCIGARFADIGTDHAYLPVWLILHGVIDKAIASDLREGPLNRARGTAQRYAIMDRISFRLCDGLAGFHPDEADMIAIAGMGGDTIASILSQAAWTKEKGKTLLLQPMTALPDLRQWLVEHGYILQSEQLCREGLRLYSIWTVRGGESPSFSPGELWAGKQTHDPLRGEYLDCVSGKAKKVLAGCQSAIRPNEVRIALLKAVITDLIHMKEEWQSWQ